MSDNKNEMFVVKPDGGYYLSAKEQKRRSAALSKILRECAEAAIAQEAAIPAPKPGDPDYVDWAAIFNGEGTRRRKLSNS